MRAAGLVVALPLVLAPCAGRAARTRPDAAPPTTAHAPRVAHISRGPIRITSYFSMRRWHPVLRRSRPHLGVDIAAPRGTPVRAIADGRITAAGRHGGLGRCVAVEHAGDVESWYGHLARVAPGIEAGHPVRAGDVIGYVGSSGLATGPHLHFGLARHGRWLDPLGAFPGVASTRFTRVARAP